MSNKLHPPNPGGPPAGSLDPKGALELAQEYKDSFERGSLHLFLQQQIRDGDFNPGDFHRTIADASLARRFHHELGHAAREDATFRP